ncbi:MAG: glutathione S-transferase [Minicystis sp.]
MADPLLVTISFSHFCEKARWALDRTGIAYRESGHLPFFHALAVRRAGGKRTTPVLVTDEGVLEDSTDILVWADKRRPAANLFGKTRDDRREVERLESYFDEALGPHTRRWAYFQVLPDREVTLAMFGAQEGVPAHQRKALAVGFPVARAIMRRVMRIDAEGAARSRQKIDEVFDTVGQQLADGRRYLVGDTLTAADITFAALAVPVVLPEGHPSRLPRVESLRAEARGCIQRWREHPAGVFALRMMREHRKG